MYYNPRERIANVWQTNFLSQRTDCSIPEDGLFKLVLLCVFQIVAQVTNYQKRNAYGHTFQHNIETLYLCFPYPKFRAHDK